MVCGAQIPSIRCGEQNQQRVKAQDTRYAKPQQKKEQKIKALDGRGSDAACVNRTQKVGETAPGQKGPPDGRPGCQIEEKETKESLRHALEGRESFSGEPDGPNIEAARSCSAERAITIENIRSGNVKSGCLIREHLNTKRVDEHERVEAT